MFACTMDMQAALVPDRLDSKDRRGADVAPRITYTRKARPSAPLPGSLTMARRESGRGDEETYPEPIT